MSSHAVAENLGFAARVALDQADTKILPVEMAREYLQMGARAIMQMWRDLEEQQEPLVDMMERIAGKPEAKNRKALA